MEFWQDFIAPPSALPPDSFAAVMPDGRVLLLPLRDLGETAVAGLIANQASFAVLDALTAWMAARAAAFAPDAVVGLPTLGHAVAPGVARGLGLSHWVPAGFSRKLWYQEALSVPIRSITSPMEGRRLWLDPRMLPRLSGRRVLLVDDVISTGASLRAGLALLLAAGVVPVAVCVAMIQGNRWQDGWNAAVPVCGAFASPLFRRGPDGFARLPDTAPHWLCQTLDHSRTR